MRFRHYLVTEVWQPTADSVTATWSASEITFVAKGTGTGRFDTGLNGVSGCEVTATTAHCPISGNDSIIMSGGARTRRAQGPYVPDRDVGHPARGCWGRCAGRR